MFRTAAVLILILLAGFAPVVEAQGMPDPAPRMALQRDAMRALAQLDGTWRGTAWVLLPTGERHNITQTERVGPFLDGTLKVIEGRGYEADGTTSFNAFGVISYNPDQAAYSIRAYTQGQGGEYVLRPTADGFVWEVPVGPGMMVRYTATVGNGSWREVGDLILPGQDPVRVVEISLTRLGNTEWPLGGSVPPR